MQVLAPRRFAEALAAKAQDPLALPLAGGTDLLVHWPQRADLHERSYIDLSRLSSELRPLRWEGDELVLGALTTYWDVIRNARAHAALPLLERAARQVGAVQIQTRGTWAGNIANASPAADGVSVLMAYDARVVLSSAAVGDQVVPLSDFYTGYKRMRLQPDQLIREIRLPLRRHDVEVYQKIGARCAQAITKVGLTLTHSDVGWRVVATSMSPTVKRCTALEALLEQGCRPATPAELWPIAQKDVKPIDDIRSTAAYRERVFCRLLFHALAAPAGGR